MGLDDSWIDPGSTNKVSTLSSEILLEMTFDWVWSSPNSPGTFHRWPTNDKKTLNKCLNVDTLSPRKIWKTLRVVFLVVSGGFPHGNKYFARTWKTYKNEKAWNRKNEHRKMIAIRLIDSSSTSVSNSNMKKTHDPSNSKKKWSKQFELSSRT